MASICFLFTRHSQATPFGPFNQDHKELHSTLPHPSFLSPLTSCCQNSHKSCAHRWDIHLLPAFYLPFLIWLQKLFHVKATTFPGVPGFIHHAGDWIAEMLSDSLNFLTIPEGSTKCVYNTMLCHRVQSLYIC